MTTIPDLYALAVKKYGDSGLYAPHREGYVEGARAAIASVPPGWKIAPIEPTLEMFAVNAPEIERAGDFATMKYRRGIWNAMLDAAPPLFREGAT